MTQSAARLGAARYPIGEASRNVIANIEHLLKVRSLSQRKLAAALYDVGRPIPALGIARILRGERRVDVDELVALAKVLETTPEGPGNAS
jgi:transcriptional regulator with XRE-family HTH domain